MKRSDVLSAINELKNSEDVELSIDALRDLMTGFCDELETDFNDIRDLLVDLAPHIEGVGEAHALAEKCALDLY